MDVYDARLKAFGLHSLVVDGHDVSELVKAFDEAATVSGKPTAIVAKTFKGKNFPGIEDLDNWHGKALGAEGEKVIKVKYKILILNALLRTVVIYQLLEV